MKTIRITRLTLIILLSLVASGSAFADLYKCDGRWTNKPCDGRKGASIKEVKKNPDAANQRAKKNLMGKKMSLVYKLLDHARTVKRKHKLTSPDTKAAEKFCQLGSTSLSDCSSKVDAAHESLKKLVPPPKKEEEPDVVIR